MALELFYKRFMESASTAYKRSMAKELNKMGKPQIALTVGRCRSLRLAHFFLAAVRYLL